VLDVVKQERHGIGALRPELRGVMARSPVSFFTCSSGGMSTLGSAASLSTVSRPTM
jgi:hypothetical protein